MEADPELGIPIAERPMNNKHSILLVDSNEAFATMLRESLEQGGEYSTTVTHSGDEAQQTLTNGSFDLAIVDLGLTDPDGATVARKLREQQADLRLILIPLIGEEIPAELANLDIQGTLPKPFFFPELPRRIGDALRQPTGKGPATMETPGGGEALEPVLGPGRPSTSHTGEERAHILENRVPEIVQAMTALTREVNADTVILTCEGELIAHAGRLSVSAAKGLAQAVGESWNTSVRVAHILGQEQLRFEQSVEGGEHMLYSLAIAEDIILSTALRANVPLGMIRHSTKATAEKLRALLKDVG
jgi:CheY-like chemotaxis protein